MSDKTDKGRAAFEALRPRLDALPVEQLASVAINVEGAAMGILAISQVIADDEDLRAKFESIPPSLFDIANLDELEQLAWATIHVSRASVKARATPSRAKLPAALISRALTIEARMQACCEYLLGDDPVAGPTLVYLRGGNGYRDLGHDLLGYAALYGEHQALVSQDPKHYRSDDREAAIEVGETIIELLGARWSNEDRELVDDYVRTWTLLRRAYDEVRETGHWLLRTQPGRAERMLPTVNVLARAATSSESSAAADATAQAPEAADEAPEVSDDEEPLGDG